MRVKVIRYGQVHFVAGCNDCDFSDAIGYNHSATHVRLAVISHVAQTGHSAWIEQGTHTSYFPDAAELSLEPRSRPSTAAQLHVSAQSQTSLKIAYKLPVFMMGIGI
jgi:hypothetical protein